LSFEAYVDLPQTVGRREAVDLFAALGFVTVPIAPFWNTKGAFKAYHWEDRRDYRSYTGTYAELAEQDGHVVAYVRTNISASYWDVAKQNECLRALRSRFGGVLRSDIGKNRYFPLPAGPPTPAESGCYMAFRRFDGNMEQSIWYLSNRNFPKNFKTGWEAKLLGGSNPWVLSNNLLLPYLVATMEDYFKSTFVALLRYSVRKEAVLKNARLSSDHLVRISEGVSSVEECFAETLPFQNLKSISDHFKAVEPKLDVRGVLHKPFRRRRVPLFESVGELVGRRHAFIHHGEVHTDFDDHALEKDIKDLYVAVDRVYGRIAQIHGWSYAPTRWRRKIPMQQVESVKDGA
jgi:hypothetical protein